MTAIVHIAGLDITIGPYLRQRCAWCDAILIDYDLTRVAVPVGQDPRPATWPVGKLVEVDGPATRQVPHTDHDPLPPNACGPLDPEATA